MLEKLSCPPSISYLNVRIIRKNPYYKRRGQPKSGTDWRDLAMLLLRFPRLKREAGPVFERLQALNDDPKVLMVWNKFVNQEIKEPSINDEF